MNITQIKKTFRTPSIEDYSELQDYSRDDIYAGKMGPGGLYLAAQMTRRMNLSPGQRVLDLGCGRGTTSVFLATQYNVSVIAVDLWVKATNLHQQFVTKGVDKQIIPLNLDITHKLPFANHYFDAIFCMDSVHYYGGTLDFWHHLLPHLKPGGTLCIGSPCFTAEFSDEMLQNLPPEYDDGSDLWPTEFSLYHSPEWWRNLIEQTGYMTVTESAELADGIIFWEDDILHNLEKGGDENVAKQDAAQIKFRRDDLPYLTHFVLFGQKNQN
ncbi:MAG TPA: methyltransferase domain-containing protein [Anaerolineae bacterium]|nr:methyltransferase domain-containing protein [Anaerolineae bacterium]